MKWSVMRTGRSLSCLRSESQAGHSKKRRWTLNIQHRIHQEVRYKLKALLDDIFFLQEHL